ncbi:MAG TPA: CAP domain-containing protein [Candidatus Paceibacterota bacterium]|nr:CAP domain-containing protein [Candidatus Paceibacterota bacterium]
MLRALKRCARYIIPSKANRYRPALLSARSLGLVLALIVLLELGILAQDAFPGRGERSLGSVLPGALAAFSNDARAERGLPSLALSERLSSAALAKAEDMARRGYFSHETPEGAEPWIFLERAGYDYTYAGENLAVNFSDSEEVTEAWLASPTHRANLLGANFSEVGFGIATGTYQGREAVFVVQFLATPASAASLPAAVSPKLSVESPREAEGAGEVKAYAVSPLDPPLRGAAFLLLALVVALFAVAMAIKLRARSAEPWSNGLLVASALAGLILLQGDFFPRGVFLPETAASVHRSLSR